MAMHQEEFVQLKWNTHQLAFIDTLSSLRDKQVYTDVTLSCGDQFYPAHRLVLSSCSTFFAKTLEVSGCKAPTILLHGIDQSTLEQLLMFMYDGQVTISREELSKLLEAAKWLGVKGLDSALDKHKVNEASSLGEAFDSAPFPEPLRQLFSSLIGTNLLQENIEDAVNFYKQIINKMQETEAANNQSSELVQDFSEPETNQEESQDIITVEKFDDFLTDPNSEELKDNSSLELKDDTSSSSFHGWTEGETDFKLNIKEIFEESREIAETNGVDSSSTPGKFTESSKENNDEAVNKRSLKCKHCRKSFKIRKDIATHLRTHHGEIHHYCFTCQIQFSNKKEFATHMKLHKAPTVHSCNMCEYVTHSQYGLNKHILVNHRASKKKSDLMLPKVQLTKERKQKSKILKRTSQNSDFHDCSSCLKRFRDETSLKEHADRGCKGIIKSKDGYHCPLCLYVSNRLRSVEDHLSRHTGIYRFRCSYCPYQCIRNFYLKDHLNKKHPEIK
ncbi:zinc finger and BTB domain-containing protein 14-like [Portunus trituberculatus]|uniref:zinc finger and BTB domain-containing protein 14-like n=1 Tax=Portunus trituberculatus TaxID=210409 RepID=UPI001E1D101F|nr:zinc finger and BTB domain-containing protein 14-like [Portunus trituberculatus]XP_045131705.1 zinc finger and BTB domain-containing protein 14-like [Portunus trituberculatus]